MADEVVKEVKVVATVDKVFKYVEYFLKAAAAVTIISTIAISNFKAGSDRAQMIKSDSTLIREVKSINTRISGVETQVIAIQLDLKDVKEKQGEQISGQNALRNSYIMHLKDDKALKLDDFLRYMNGVEWEIKNNKLMIDTTKNKQAEFSIKSQKINKPK